MALPCGWKVNVHEEFQIRNGPNDWDMWLSLREKWRGSHNSVDFLLDRPLITQSEGVLFGNKFSAKITGVWMTECGIVEWHITGRICSYKPGLVHDRKTKIRFEAVYSPHDRSGTIRFFEDEEVPQ